MVKSADVVWGRRGGGGTETEKERLSVKTVESQGEGKALSRPKLRVGLGTGENITHGKSAPRLPLKLTLTPGLLSP